MAEPPLYWGRCWGHQGLKGGIWPDVVCTSPPFWATTMPRGRISYGQQLGHLVFRITFVGRLFSRGCRLCRRPRMMLRTGRNLGAGCPRAIFLPPWCSRFVVAFHRDLLQFLFLCLPPPSYCVRDFRGIGPYKLSPIPTLRHSASAIITSEGPGTYLF